MNLLALQRNLRDHLIQGSPDIGREIRGDPAARLAVYHHAYRAQLMDCLRDMFERVWAWLGDAGFESAGQKHIELHPPHGWTLAEYGSGFDHTLKDLYPSDPELAELAWLDWSLRRAFDGPDANSIEGVYLSRVNWNNAILCLVPTLHIAPIATNCAAIWTALSDSRSPPGVQRLAAPMALRVWRVGLTPRFRSIDALEQHALQMVIEGATFATICKTIESARHSKAAEVAGSFLASWLQDGLITSVENC
jgi:hypothetical protein